MKITKKSVWSGITRTMEIPVTQEQLNNWTNGELIQNAMPNLTESQREFLVSGMSDEEWDEMHEEQENDS